ncbi:hypothetical protein EOL96_04570 [Candidatus Saccharibacteria bacterium]|nr:hypothetical protein [Candidatus Saccharibacteria bacterium]
MSERTTQKFEKASDEQVRHLYDMIVAQVADHGENAGPYSDSNNIYNVSLPEVPVEIATHFTEPGGDIDDTRYLLFAFQKKDWKTQELKTRGEVASIAVEQVQAKGRTKYVTRLNYWFEVDDEGAMSLERRTTVNEYGPQSVQRDGTRLMGFYTTREVSLALLEEAQQLKSAYLKDHSLQKLGGTLDVSRREADELLVLTELL